MTSDFFVRVLSRVAEENRRFISALRDLDEEGWRAPTLCPGWRVADVVSHMTLGARFYARVIPAGAAGRLEAPFGTTDLESFWAYRKKTGDALAALPAHERTAAFEKAVWRLQEVFEGVAPGALDKNAWHWLAPCPIRTFPGQRLYELILHDWDIRNRPDDDLRPEAADMAVDCLPERLPIFWRARGHADLRASIRFETQAPERRWTLHVGGEGRPDIAFSGDAACHAQITCGGSDLVLITTGRASWEAREGAGRLRIEGDRAKAVEVLAVLAQPF